MAQGTVYKSVLKNAAYIFFIKLFPAFASIIVLVLYSRNLPQTDYGNYQELWVKILLFGTLAYIGLPVTIITYSADFIKYFFRQIRPRHVVLYALWALLCVGTFGYFMFHLGLPVWLLVALPLLYAGHAVQEALLMASKKMTRLLVVNAMYALYFLGVHVAFLEGYDLIRLLQWLSLGMLVRLVLLTLLVVLVYKRVEVQHLTADALHQAQKLWMHLGLYDLIQTLFRYVDKFILVHLLSAGLFAVYFNGVQSAEVPLLPYLLGAVASSLLLQLSDKTHAATQSFQLLRESGKLLSCIVFPLFIFLFLFAEEIFVLVFTEKYLDSVSVFRAAICVLPLRSYNYTTMLQHLHRGAIINKGAILDLLLAVALMYPFYQWWGIVGVAFAFVLSTYLQVVYYLWQTARLASVQLVQLLPLKNWVLKLLGCSMLLFTLDYLLQSATPSVRLGVGVVAMALIMMVSLKLELRRSLRS